MTGGDTPVRTDSDDWFDEPRAGSRATSSPDDWVASAPARDARPGRRASARRRLSPRATLTAVLVLAVLLAAGVVLALLFTGSDKPHATPPATLPTTTTHAVTTTKTPATNPGLTAPTVTLKPGDTGVQVKRLQRFLRLFGYSTSPADGSYGPATQEAVKRFQQATNLTADGIAGPATLRALKAALGKRR